MLENGHSPMLGLFRESRVSPPMRVLSLSIILAATLSIISCGPRNQDKLEDSELAGAQSGTRAQADTRCTSVAVSDEIKRQLFARAAEIRGSNADNYAKIAGFALLDTSAATPVAAVAASELADCRGRLILRLPAGLKVAGGRTSLSGDVSYSVAPGIRGIVTLGQSDSIAIPLATLTQNRAVDSPAAPPATPPSSEISPTVADPVVVHRSEPDQLAPVETTNAGRPSFDCRRARSASEHAVCDSPSLSRLDRDMADQYRSGLANAEGSQRRLLEQTRDRFLAYRERCSTDACIATTYRGRMREIDDIMAGRWIAPR